MVAHKLADKKSREIFDASYRRCTANRSFIQRFYDIFVQSSPEIAAKFEHTDMSHQSRMLQVSLAMLLSAAEGKEEGVTHLKRIARVHGKSAHNIPAGMYDLWMQSLLQAVKEFDPNYGIRIEQAWRAILEPGIQYMKVHQDLE